MFNPFGNYDPELKIIIFSLMVAMAFTLFSLGVVLCGVWLIERRRFKRAVRTHRAVVMAEIDVQRHKDALRRKKERAARKTRSNETFYRELQKVLSE